MKISFVLSRKPNRTDHLIVMICRWSGNQVKFSTGELVTEDQWQAPRQRCYTGSRFPDGGDINQLLDSMTDDITRKFRNFIIEQKREPSKVELKDLMSMNTNKVDVDPLSFIESQIEHMTRRVNAFSGKKLTHGTIKMYRVVYHALIEFSKVRQITWNNIDAQFYERYVSWLSARYAKNTMGKHISKFKYFMREAEALGYPVNPYYKSRSFKTFSEASSRICLSPEDVTAIRDLTITDLKMRELRDVFVISCYSGLRFSDWHKLPEALSKFPGFIALSRQTKTGAPAIVPIHDDIKEICERHKDGFRYHSLLINQNVNEQLKQLGEMAGLTEPVRQEITRGGKIESTLHRKCDLISTHTGRRTFITNTYRSGFDTKALSTIMGFTSEKEFIKYIKVGDMERAKMLEAHWKRTS